MNRRAIRFLAGLTLLGPLVVACGDDDDESDTPEPAASSAPSTAAPAATSTEAPATTGAATETTAAAGSDGGEAAAGDFVIEEFAFPEGFTATAGEEFTVTNNDGSTHTVTSTDFSVRVSGGASEPLTIADPGEYSIFCEIHPQMTGTITVE